MRDHLKTLQRPPHNVIRGGDDTIDKVAAMYEHARFENRVSILNHTLFLLQFERNCKDILSWFNKE